MDFSSTLLREKFVIRDSKSDMSDPPVIALSNRISVMLLDQRGRISEVFVVRSQIMHACLRMAAKIVQTYNREGPIMVRDESYNFEAAWEEIISDHEKKFNEKCWIAVYNSGKRIFGSGEYHAFLDVIENCENKNTTGNYDTSVALAEDIFAMKGKLVTIEHQASTGMVLDVKRGRGRCGLILRSPTRRTNFTYTAEEKPEKETSVSIGQCLTVAAAFLEGIHLAFLVGRTNERLRLELTQKYGDEDRHAVSARRRLARLNAEIKSFETVYQVRYRPERPEFSKVVIEAEEFTRDLWEREQAEKEMMEDGAIQP